MPSNVPRYGEFHEGKLWFERKGSTITVGLTDSAIDELGEIESVEFPDEGTDFSKGEALVTIEGTRGSLEVMTPASGLVESINGEASGDPTIISEDPTEGGWLLKLELDDPSELSEYKDTAHGAEELETEDEDEEEDDEDEDEDEDEDDDFEDDLDDEDDEDLDEDEEEEDLDEDGEDDEEEKPRSRGRKKADDDE